MLLLAHATWPGQVAVASVDHGLREAAADECAFVARLCRDIGIPHSTLKVEVGPGNVQARAREARYAALNEWCGEHEKMRIVATAHHLDDQVETLIMRLNRGSGLSGLQGIQPFFLLDPESASDALVVRPLLHWRRKELAAIVEAAGIKPVADPSNGDDRFDRARLRKQLGDVDWIDAENWGRSAELLQRTSAMVSQLLSADRQGNWQGTGDGGIMFFPNRPKRMRSQLIDVEHMHYFIGAMQGDVDRTQALRVVESLERGEPMNVGGVLVRPVQHDGEPAWLFRREPPRRTG